MKIRRSTVRATTAVLGTAAVAGVAWIALPAAAATTGVVSLVSGNIVTYTAATGKANNVALARSGNTVIVDDVHAIQAGAGLRTTSAPRRDRMNASVRVPPVRPVTASHSRPLSRSRMAVCSRKSRISAGCRARTSSAR